MEDENDCIIDAFDTARYYDYYLKENGQEKTIKLLVKDVSLLYHFISKLHPEFSKFLDAVENLKVTSDEGLEWNLNPPQIPDGAILKDVDDSIRTKDKEEW